MRKWVHTPVFVDNVSQESLDIVRGERGSAAAFCVAQGDFSISQPLCNITKKSTIISPGPCHGEYITRFDVASRFRLEKLIVSQVPRKCDKTLYYLLWTEVLIIPSDDFG